MIQVENLQDFANGYNLTAPVFAHVFPRSGNSLSYYQDVLVFKGKDGMSTENKYQNRNNFRNAGTIINLLPLDRNERYIFAGAYDVSSGPRETGLNANGDTVFIIENTFSDNAINKWFGRVTFKWSSPCRNRYLNIGNTGMGFQFIEIREFPFGISDVPFPGFYSFHLNRQQFDLRIGGGGAPTWKAALSSVAGIYVITDASTGDSYVGSAYSSTGMQNQGLWGRWRGYVNGGHNGNAMLRSHINANGADNLIYSILHTMDSGSSKDDVIRLESFYKKAFGTRVHGLNLN